MHVDRQYIEAKYFETYYFANVIRNILHDQSAYIRNLNDFYGDERYLNFLEPFPKHSAFHSFIEFIVESVFFEDLRNIDLAELRNEEKRFECMPETMRPNNHALPVNRALNYHAIDHRSFDEWLSDNSTSFDDANTDDVYEYFQNLQREGAIGNLLERVVAELFFILFSNRGLMRLFNAMMAREIASLTLHEIPDESRDAFKRDGVFARRHIPTWVQKAVFFRDRGQCVLCKADISGLVCIVNSKNFDHIVPLSHGGLNDVSNIQLLCASCNNDKRDYNTSTSDVYEAWY
ncbi:HNH endonuclease [Rosistilla carotiformis]|uniref:HNH endonuclease n=1 Tax=Rosistilla carotiformis TaxID=2528017 RepID=A0A518JR53_9BACT|nr:HNH endonuclease signature motif containing protein [Rosistilla carotiformis]QDV68014.1 HNH endonuclease [Rosistilla carotiformis]